MEGGREGREVERERERDIYIYTDINIPLCAHTRGENAFHGLSKYTLNPYKLQNHPSRMTLVIPLINLLTKSP